MVEPNHHRLPPCTKPHRLLKKGRPFAAGWRPPGNLAMRRSNLITDSWLLDLVFPACLLELVQEAAAPTTLHLVPPRNELENTNMLIPTPSRHPPAGAAMPRRGRAVGSGGMPPQASTFGIERLWSCLSPVRLCTHHYTFAPLKPTCQPIKGLSAALPFDNRETPDWPAAFRNGESGTGVLLVYVVTVSGRLPFRHECMPFAGG